MNYITYGAKNNELLLAGNQRVFCSLYVHY